MRLIATIIIVLSCVTSIAQPSVSVTTTNCSTWDCTPCDGTFTVTLSNPNSTGPYTFWMYADSAGTILLDSATVAGTSYTFTDICQGYYWTNMTWPLPPIPQIPCTNCVGADTCALCPPGVGGGSGGGGAGGAVGAPCPPLSIGQEPDILDCGGMYFGTSLSSSFPGATVNWTASGGFGSLSGTGTIVPDFPLGTNDFYSVTATSSYVMLDGTICSSPPMTFSVYSVDPGFGYNPDVYVCEGDWIDSDALCWSGTHYDLNWNFVNTPYYPAASTTLTCLYPPSQFDCGGSVYTNIIVVPLPTVDAGVDQIICFGEGLVLNGTSADPAYWEGGEINGNTIYPNVGVHDYIYTAINDDGCMKSDTVQITVMTSNTIDAGTDIVVCENEQVALFAASSEPFLWNNGVVDGQLFFPAAGDYIVTTTSGGCVGTDTVNVALNPIPAISGGANLSVCLGDSVTLTGIGGIGHVWDQGVQDGISFIPPLGITWYNVIGTDANGCVGGNAVEVTVHALPVIEAGLNDTICFGDGVALAGNGGTSYSWDNNVMDNTIFYPTSTNAYVVTGTDANGCQNTDQVDVVVNPLPVIDGGQDVTLCLGDSVQLNATGGLSYVWDTGTLNGEYLIPPVGITTAIVTGTDGNGCSHDDTLMITVNPLPIIDAGIDQSICLGDSVQVTASGGATYVWNNGIIDGIWFTPVLGATTYIVTGTDSNGCINSDSLVVNVMGLPVIDAGLNDTICFGDGVMLSGNGGTSYSWDNNVMDNTIFYPTLTSTYTVIGTDTNGCQNTDQVDVVVNPLPLIDAGQDVTLCLGDSVQLNATGAVSYVWNTSTANGDYFTPPVGATTAILTGIDSNGCSQNDTVTLVVSPPPAIDAGSDQIVCEGDSITLQATGAGLISWSNSIQNNIPFIQGVGVQTYYVSIFDAFGCGAVDSVLVTMEPTPIVSFTADDVEGCSPLSVTFTNTTLGNLTDCLWEFSNGDVQSGCGNVTTTFNDPGLYDVELTVFSINGCTASLSELGYIYIEEDPIAAFTMSPNEVGMLNTQVVFDNNSIGATSYVWDFGDGTSGSTVTHPNHEFPNENAGSYEVELIAYSALMCPDTAYQYLTVKEDLVYYVPNSFTPDGDAHNQTFQPVFSSGFDAQDYELTIFNRWGEVVFQSRNYEVGWDGVCANGYCQDGVYTWRIEFKMKDGDEREIIHGHVNLLR